MNIFSQWQRRKFPHQFFAVVRHEERADALDAAYISGKHWCKSKDFADWPLDPPLSDKGLQNASTLGKHLKQLSSDVGSQFHIVLSSPYHRCMQTAATICKALGPDTRLLVDLSLGEVYGPGVLGDDEPRPPFVRFRHQPGSDGIRTVGRWPTWPESFQDARLRYARRFLEYLRRSHAARRNFVIVSHRDCIGATLSVMPSMSDSIIDRIDTGGMFFAQRRQTSKSTVSEAEEDLEIDATQTEHGASMPDPPAASDGWQVRVRKIDLRKKMKTESKEFSVKLSVEELLSGLQLDDAKLSWDRQITNDSALIFGKSESGSVGTDRSPPISPLSPSARQTTPPTRTKSGCNITRKVFDHYNAISQMLEADVMVLHKDTAYLPAVQVVQSVEDAMHLGKPLDLGNSSLMKRRNLSSGSLATKVSL
mmetsp:Transcript_81882/g.144897  ORF Transcript_81882/g.144897 Transcript_81882/m.144897 type:complete len:422 (-) Transcript_81882:47-1312(-)